jgi:hypothetical protein
MWCKRSLSYICYKLTKIFKNIGAPLSLTSKRSQNCKTYTYAIPMDDTYFCISLEEGNNHYHITRISLFVGDLNQTNVEVKRTLDRKFFIIFLFRQRN